MFKNFTDQLFFTLLTFLLACVFGIFIAGVLINQDITNLPIDFLCASFLIACIVLSFRTTKSCFADSKLISINKSKNHFSKRLDHLQDMFPIALGGTLSKRMNAYSGHKGLRIVAVSATLFTLGFFSCDILIEAAPNSFSSFEFGFIILIIISFLAGHITLGICKFEEFIALAEHTKEDESLFIEISKKLTYYRNNIKYNSSDDMSRGDIRFFEKIKEFEVGILSKDARVKAEALEFVLDNSNTSLTSSLACVLEKAKLKEPEVLSH